MGKRGPKPLFGRPLTNAERQARFRERRDAALAALPDPYEAFHLSCTTADMNSAFPDASTLEDVMAAAPELGREITA